MSLIERRDGGGFRAYLSRTQNTICGRNPIKLMLAALAVAERLKAVSSESQRGSVQVEFVAYAQSSRAISKADSSVSYASAVIRGP